MKISLLTVDPGAITGMAYWFDNKLINTDTIRSKGKLENSYQFMWNEFKRLVMMKGPDVVVIESVHVWEQSTVSMTAARKGDLMKLAYLVGGYMQLTFQYGADVSLISAQRWKGQLPDKIVRNRVLRYTEKIFTNQHLNDAVGIGIYTIEGEF